MDQRIQKKKMYELILFFLFFLFERIFPQLESRANEKIKIIRGPPSPSATSSLVLEEKKKLLEVSQKVIEVKISMQKTTLAAAPYAPFVFFLFA